MCHQYWIIGFLFRFSAQDWLEKIEEKYFDERDDLVRQCFQAALENVTEPYSFILHVIQVGFFDLFSKRIPITYFALDELSIWLALKVREQINRNCHLWSFKAEN